MNLEEQCYYKACHLIQSGVAYIGTDVFELTNMLYNLECEKLLKDQLSDQNIEFNDPIVSIEEVGDQETIDIGVSGDNLFYCNDILTKNSWGLPATVDGLFGIISTEDMEELNQIMMKQLKNRFGDINKHKRFVIGLDRSKMKLYNLEQSAQDDIMDDTPSPSYSPNKQKPKFDGVF